MIFYLCLFNVFINLAAERTYSTCYAGRTKSGEQKDVSTVCPGMSPDAGVKNIGCKVVLGEQVSKEPHYLYATNDRCSTCDFRVESNQICHKSLHSDVRECCCLSPNCNRLVLLDASIGWKRQTHPSGCVIATFTNETNKWDVFPDAEDDFRFIVDRRFINHDEVLQKVKDERQSDLRASCIMLMKVDNTTGSLISLLLAEKKGLSCEAGIRRPDGCLIRYDRNVQVTDCCCTGYMCNQKIYRDRAFDLLMTIRSQNELTFFQRSQSRYATTLPKVIWAMETDYLNRKPYIDLCFITITAFHFLLMFYLYRKIRPIDMEKRPKPVGAPNNSVISNREQH